MVRLPEEEFGAEFGGVVEVDGVAFGEGKDGSVAQKEDGRGGVAGDFDGLAALVGEAGAEVGPVAAGEVDGALGTVAEGGDEQFVAEQVLVGAFAGRGLRGVLQGQGMDDGIAAVADLLQVGDEEDAEAFAPGGVGEGLVAVDHGEAGGEGF